MSQKVLISNRQTRKALPTSRIQQKSRQILDALGYDQHEISIVFTDDNEIRDLNSRYRGIEKATNVLSFSMLEGDIPPPDTTILGDVVISVETAEKEAAASGLPFELRISQLLVHGILHLAGFNHEKGGTDFNRMEKKSYELLTLIEDNTRMDIF